ncbi:MAG: winged helix-turn-helix domain-containing protein [Proteobacteria bacterium]|nr:winged helix-turn-helix domain-containing protein [Pseudomonadota bacterium]
MLRIGALIVDLATGGIEGPGHTDRLTGFEAGLLRYLVSRPGEAVSRADLIEHVWEAPVSDRAVDQAVRRLRRRLEPQRRHSTLILSVRGVGYRFLAPRKVVVRARSSRLDSLDPWLRNAFSACCAFPGPFEVAAARVVAEVPEAVLRALTRHGLLASFPSEGRGGARYAVIDGARVEPMPSAQERYRGWCGDDSAAASAARSA